MNWFGELPAHWGVKRVRHIGTLKGGAGFPHERQGRQDGELPFFKVKDLGDAEMPLVSTDNYVSRETATELRANVFPARTIVFAKVGAALMLNRFRILGVPGCIDNNMMGLTIDEGVMTVRFALSALALIDFKIVANPGAVPSVNEGQVSDYPLPVPPLSEQLAIANFLDRETARVDELVAAKQRVLDLLAEKRKAIIATAVTRGLDPKVKLRDSGVPWLGEIPAHWEIKRARWHFRERDERDESELPLMEVSIANGVSVREFSEDRIEATAADFGTYKVARRNDIAFNKMRMWQGAVGVSPADGLVSPDYVVAEPTGGMLASFAGLLFRTEMFSAECGRRSHGITWDRLRIYWDEFREIELPVPPMHEQHAIVAHITHETAKIDAVRAATERTIALLKERRAALIAAAVTGQLDLEASA